MSSSSTDPVDEVTSQTDARAHRRLRSLVVGTVVAVVLAVLLFVVLKPTAASPTGQSLAVSVGSVAPQFSLPNLMSTAAAPLPPVNLDALGKDRHRPVVLNFYASWCPPCRAESPLFAATAKAQAAKGSPVQFVGVDVADEPSAAVPFTRQAGITYPVGADRTLRVTSVLYGLNGQPNTFFINEQGVVIGHVIGQVGAATLNAWLHKLAGAAG